MGKCWYSKEPSIVHKMKQNNLSKSEVTEEMYNVGNLLVKVGAKNT